MNVVKTLVSPRGAVFLLLVVLLVAVIVLNPNFAEPAGLIHIPSKAVLEPDELAVKLTYGDATCRLSLDVSDSNHATVTYALETPSDLPIEAHATFIPDEHLAKGWKTASGKSGTLKDPFKLTSDECGGAFDHNGWRVRLPAGATVVWPVLPHDQYRKDGRADLFQGRIVVVMPLGKEPKREQVVVEIP